MASSRPDRIEAAIVSWRREFGRNGAIHSEDLDELADHLRDIVEMRLSAGDTFSVAEAFARNQIGEADELIDEMKLVRRPPSYYRRLCVGLAAYAAFQTGIITAVVAGLSMTAYLYGIKPVQATNTYELSLLSVVAGIGLIEIIRKRFQLRRGGLGITHHRSILRTFGPVLGLIVILYLGLVFGDFWRWWLVSAGQFSDNRWSGFGWVVLLGLGGPVSALTAATSLHRWHPSLQGKFSGR